MSGAEAKKRKRQFKSGSQMWHEKAPKIDDALRRVTFVTVTTRDGEEISGNVCDHDGSGLLLDLYDWTDEPLKRGYMFIPWVNIKYTMTLGTERRKPGETIFSD